VTFTNCLALGENGVILAADGARINKRLASTRVSVILSITLMLSIFIPSQAFGFGREYRSKQAAKLVGDALRLEIDGKNLERDEALRQARLQLPEFPPAMWHQGFVRIGKRWVHIDQLGEQRRKDKTLDEYVRLRASTPETVNGQWALANWCRNSGLLPQERAHLSHALDFSPDNPTILNRLGFRRINGAWVSQADLETAFKLASAENANLATWSKRMQEIRKGLEHGNSRRRKVSEEMLTSIRDPSAIASLERQAHQSGKAASLAVQAIAGISDYRAALALARLAVSSGVSEIQTVAAEHLRERDRDHFVPAMLAAMHTPINTRTLSYSNKGRVHFLQSFEREGQYQREQYAVRMNRVAPNAETQLAKKNLNTIGQNVRIAQALNIATEQQLSADPKAWWDWWNKTNEIYFDGGKPIRVAGAIEEVRQSELERRQQATSQELESIRQQSLSSGRFDCLAPGTSIWTSSGVVEVERIRPGDLVLSQDSETGEVALKPVLRTTLRPETELVKLTVDDEVIEASGGHPFWVAGQGWVKARDLKIGMALHGVTSAHRITSVEQGRKSVSHNLIVADFNSYFVGPQKILSHDNTVRRPTNAIVPGLASR
jgi:hypothetical protein